MYIRVWGNGCTHYLLAQHWVNLSGSTAKIEQTTHAATIRRSAKSHGPIIIYIQVRAKTYMPVENSAHQELLRLDEGKASSERRVRLLEKLRAERSGCDVTG